MRGEEGDGTERKGRATERVMVSCVRLQLCATHWDVRSSRMVHWYDGRVMGKERKGEEERERKRRSTRSTTLE
jgi:hypothetical protein